MSTVRPAPRPNDRFSQRDDVNLADPEYRRVLGTVVKKKDGSEAQPMPSNAAKKNSVTRQVKESRGGGKKGLGADGGDEDGDDGDGGDKKHNPGGPNDEDLASDSIDLNQNAASFRQNIRQNVGSFSPRSK
jgi:hypothetical protein